MIIVLLLAILFAVAVAMVVLDCMLFLFAHWRVMCAALGDEIIRLFDSASRWIASKIAP